MPRWLVNVVLAFLLSCFGFAVAAQTPLGARQHGCDQAQAGGPAHEMPLRHGAELGLPADAGEESPGNDEQRHDCNEILIGTPGPFVPAAVAESAAPAPPALGSSPFLERPKRPPRA
jgi:hypothetical protein